jgi:hypothetical protein
MRRSGPMAADEHDDRLAVPGRAELIARLEREQELRRHPVGLAGEFHLYLALAHADFGEDRDRIHRPRPPPKTAGARSPRETG